MQTAKTKPSAKRQRTSTRYASNYRPHHRMNTSCGQPVHISHYIASFWGEDGKIDREKFIQSFNSEYDG
jgi:hypothetical protein